MSPPDAKNRANDPHGQAAETIASNASDTDIEAGSAHGNALFAPVPSVYRTASHASGPDGFDPTSAASAPKKKGKKHGDEYREEGDELYDRLSSGRKHIVVAVMSFCAFLSPQSSTSVLAATPEVAKTFNTTGSIINISNAAYMVFMGLSPIVWGPMSQVFGRRPVSKAC